MIIEHIDSRNFDKNFKKLLETKKEKNIVRGRFDLESIELSKKSGFIINLLSSINSIVSLTYKVLFWEEDNKVESLIKSNFENIKYEIVTPYKQGKLPGIVFIEEKTINNHFLEALLNNHFNYEMAVDPSLDMRVQLCINQENFITLLDIYDDRGFDIYYLNGITPS